MFRVAAQLFVEPPIPAYSFDRSVSAAFVNRFLGLFQPISAFLASSQFLWMNQFLWMKRNFTKMWMKFLIFVSQIIFLMCHKYSQSIQLFYFMSNLVHLCYNAWIRNQFTVEIVWIALSFFWPGPRHTLIFYLKIRLRTGIQTRDQLLHVKAIALLEIQSKVWDCYFRSEFSRSLFLDLKVCLPFEAGRAITSSDVWYDFEILEIEL